MRSNDGNFGSGGGLFNAGTATISHSAFIENDGSDPDAYEGGGLENNGSMTIATSR